MRCVKQTTFSPRPRQLAYILSVLTEHSSARRQWIHESIRRIEADGNRSADTHLFSVPLPHDWGIDLYLKDESTHRTGSLKHRLARSLFLYALVNGDIHEDSTIVEASSGSTAVSEAYFASLLGLKFIAVMAKTTSPEKIALIENYGGRCAFVDSPGEVYAKAAELAEATGGHYMDQFTFAERATDWRGNNNIANSIFDQMRLEPHPIPAWIVVGAGTGGTSATIGRYLRYHRHATNLAVVDPENSVFYSSWAGIESPSSQSGSRIEGIGRARLEPSFVPGVIDAMIQVPDRASIAAMQHLKSLTGIAAGPSTGTNLWGVWGIIANMLENGERGSVVTLLCDPGERYTCTYYDDEWLASKGLAPRDEVARIENFLATGTW